MAKTESALGILRFCDESNVWSASDEDSKAYQELIRRTTLIPRADWMGSKYVCPEQQQQDSASSTTMAQFRYDASEFQFDKSAAYSFPHAKLSQYELGKVLGLGHYGIVFVARKEDGVRYAVKVMSLSFARRYDYVERIQREIEVMSRTSHPNIVKMIDAFADSQFVYIVLEYADQGCLYDLARKQPRRSFPEERVAKWTRQICSALIYLREMNVIHRDIKLENILVCSAGDSVKLADFGWCAVLSSRTERRRTMCGTLDYLSPEMVTREPYDSGVDLWSLGVCIFECLEGRAPFECEDQADTYERIQRLDYRFRPQANVSYAARSLITALLRKSRFRLTLEELQNHPFLGLDARFSITA